MDDTYENTLLLQKDANEFGNQVREAQLEPYGNIRCRFGIRSLIHETWTIGIMRL